MRNINIFNIPTPEFKPVSYTSTPIKSLNPRILLNNDLTLHYNNNILQYSPDLLNNPNLSTLINLLIKDLESILTPGYLNNSDLKEYPIIQSYLDHILTNPQNINNTKYIKGTDSHILHKEILNLHNLLNYHILFKQSKLNCPFIEGTDEIIEYELELKDLYNRLDPSFRKYLLPTDIKIQFNRIIGFDTEYEVKDSLHNNLLSIQLSTSVETIIKINKNSTDLYKPTIINAQTSESIITNYNPDFNVQLLSQTYETLLKELRFLNNYPDSLIKELVDRLRTISYISYYGNDTDYHIFKLPSTIIQNYIDHTNECNLPSLLSIVTSMTDYHIESTIQNLQELFINKDNSLTRESFIHQPLINKSYLTYEDLSEFNINNPRLLSDLENKVILLNDKMNMNISTRDYLCSHYNAADLSMLSDFDTIKNDLSIIGKSFVTFKPLSIKDTYGENHKIYIRDTMLIAPQGAKSLKDIGSIYNINKIELTNQQINNMKELMNTDLELFNNYAINDSVIAVNHSLFMFDFYFKLGKVGVPTTLGNIATKYVYNKWRDIEYKGYQIDEINVNSKDIINPTTINLSNNRDVILKLPNYIASYKGGRNESYMYGIDEDTIYYDYDLTSAYTTVLYSIGHPDYFNYQYLNKEQLEQLSDEEIINSFMVINTGFIFNENILYPSIPQFIDKFSSAYVLNGHAFIHGTEYLLARNQGCELDINNVFIIKWEEGKYPFKEIINEIQSMRRKYPKGDINNLMYKEIGNSIYGGLARGVKVLDDDSANAIELSNVILASWVTAFIRSILGELLHYTNELASMRGGRIISATTDGFITDIENLEEKVSKFDMPLFNRFKSIRQEICGDNTGLEVKSSGKGIISWTVRGQVDIESKIKAATGFQSKYYSHQQFKDIALEAMKSENKNIKFIKNSLRSPKDIIKEGGHVTAKFNEQNFEFKFNNMRSIQIENKELFISKPWNNIKQAKNIKNIKNNYKKAYNAITSMVESKYKDDTELSSSSFSCIVCPLCEVDIGSIENRFWVDKYFF